MRRIGGRREGGFGLDDPGLLPCDARRRIVGRSRFGREQESFVVDAERSDTRGSRGRDDVGRVKAAAKPNPAAADGGGDWSEGEEGRGGGGLAEKIGGGASRERGGRMG